MGDYTTASGGYSTAMGGTVQVAFGQQQWSLSRSKRLVILTAMGQQTIASGEASTAMGFDTV